MMCLIDENGAQILRIPFQKVKGCRCTTRKAPQGDLAQNETLAPNDKPSPRCMPITGLNDMPIFCGMMMRSHFYTLFGVISTPFGSSFYSKGHIKGALHLPHIC